jgi:DNA-directed RNA polymerase subunit RPC12/RpoP
MSSGRLYACGQCRHRFRTPENLPWDRRMVMCPLCGSHDLTLEGIRRRPSVVWMARPGVRPAEPMMSRRAVS